MTRYKLHWQLLSSQEPSLILPIVYSRGDLQMARLEGYKRFTQVAPCWKPQGTILKHVSWPTSLFIKEPTDVFEGLELSGSFSVNKSIPKDTDSYGYESDSDIDDSEYVGNDICAMPESEEVRIHSFPPPTHWIDLIAGWSKPWRGRLLNRRCKLFLRLSSMLPHGRACRIAAAIQKSKRAPSDMNASRINRSNTMWLCRILLLIRMSLRLRWRLDIVIQILSVGGKHSYIISTPGLYVLHHYGLKVSTNVEVPCLRAVKTNLNHHCALRSPCTVSRTS